MRKELKLPDVGEGVAEGEVLRWLVQEGAEVEEGQPLVEIMTDKVNVELPSPMKAKVEKILAKEGSTVNVGGPLAVIATAGEEAEAPIEPTRPTAPSHTILATPATRRLAQDLGVDLTLIAGTGPSGRITDEDVRRHVQKAVGVPVSAPPEMAKLEERMPLHGLRKRTAERMTLAARNIAIVTHIDEADVTELVKVKDELKTQAEARNIKLTYLPFIVKSTAEVLKR
ncbi:MAG: biotin/lipoyl-containing protein, partial [Candidatus Bathyarchaeia archaeon]